MTTEWLDVVRVWWTVITQLVPYLLFQRPWLSDRHRSSGHIIDLFEPVLDCLRSPVGGRRFEVRPVADVRARLHDDGDDDELDDGLDDATRLGEEAAALMDAIEAGDVAR